MAEFQNFEGNPPGADPDHWLCAYFLDLITDEEFVDRWSDNNEYACFPWFYIGQKHELNDRAKEAKEAYGASVALGELEGSHHIKHWSAYRLSLIDETDESTSTD